LSFDFGFSQYDFVLFVLLGGCAPMTLSEEQIHGLGVALNEASLLGLEVSAERHLAAATFAVLTLPEIGPPPQDPRRQIQFHCVGRVAASLRHGRWDDPKAPVETFPLGRLLEIVQSFEGSPIYGWEFFDVHDKRFPKWSDRLSLDFRCSPTDPEHSIMLFQGGGNRILDICVWFNEFTIHSPSGSIVKIEDFISGGKRWWDALYAGDERVSGRGIFPLKQ
jgi:hypothetical protein